MTSKTRSSEAAVPVLFRTWKPTEGHGVFALFPTVPSDSTGRYVDAYEDGMHSGASLAACIDASRPAEPREYAQIKRELETRGYKLKVYERTPPDAREKFLAALRRSGSGRGGGGAKTEAVKRVFQTGRFFPERQRMLEAASEEFPATFGLRGFPGDTFRISETASYIGGAGNATPILYTERRRPDGSWVDFAKGTREELLRQVTAAPRGGGGGASRGRPRR